MSPAHAKLFELAKAGGALVTSVENDGPADRAGLEIGDIILKFNDQELTSTDELVRAVSDAAPGSSAKLQVWRNGTAREMTVKLGEADSERMAQKPEPRDKAAEPGQLGLTLRELSRDERRALHTEGYLVVEAVAGVAAGSGVQRGDIIVAINSQRVSGIRQLRAELAKVGKRAAVLVQREGNMIFIPLKFQDE